MVPGTNMTFAGIPRGKERADLITFLNSKSDKPARAAEGRPRAPAAEKQAGRQRRQAGAGRRAPKPH